MPWRCCARWMHGVFVALALMLAPPLVGQDTAFAWTVGSRVHAAAAVYARADTLGLGMRTLHVAGDKATITGGPAGRTTAWGVSWFLHYDTPPDGWSTQRYLVLDSLARATLPPVAAASVSVSPVSMSLELMPLGVQAVATVRDSARNILPWPVVWSSQNPAIAKVDSSGYILPVAVGTTTIVATSGGRSGSTAVTVTPARVPAATVPGLFCSTLAKFGVRCAAGTYGPWPAYADSTGAIAGHFTVIFTP